MIESKDNKVISEVERVPYEKINIRPNKSELESVDSKFKEKAQLQVNKILKDLNLISSQGSKTEISEADVEILVSQIREVLNTTKKQFSSALDKKEAQDLFGVLNSQVSKTLKEIKILGELADRHSGEFTEEHVKAIFEVLKKKTNDVKKDLKNKDEKETGFYF